MLKYFWRSSLRNLTRNKFFSLINIFGLSAGIACCLIIYLFVRYEYSFDSFHRYYRDTYLVINDSTHNRWERSAFVDYRIASYLKEKYPDVVSSCSMLMGQGELQIAQDFFPVNLLMTDSGFFNVFSFPLIRGNPATALVPGNVIVTRALAEKIFHSTDVLGKTVKLGDIDLIISGVTEEIPPNSSIRFDIITLHNNNIFYSQSCNMNKCFYPKNVFIRLQSHENPAIFLSRLTNPVELEKGLKTYLGLKPFKALYFWQDNTIDAMEKGNLKMIRIFSFIALIVLLLAVMNYINLSVSRMMNRVRESGIKKSLGARQGILLKQIIFESVLLAAMSFVIAMVFTAFAIPLINSLYEKQIHFTTLFHFPDCLLWMTGPFILGLLAGIYPAIVFAGQTTLDLLTKKTGKIPGKNPFIKILPVFQFSASLVLIVTLIIIYKQIQFVKHVNLGFDKDQLVWIGFPRSDKAALTAFINKLNQEQGVLGTSLSMGGPGRINMMVDNNDTNGKTADQINIDSNFLKIFNIPLVTGRKILPGDIGKVAYVNETAVKSFGWDSLEGKKYEGKEIIGIVKDFHVNSLYQAIDPVVLVYDSANYFCLNVKLTGKNIPSTLGFIHKQWKSFFPDSPFNYSFFDEYFDHMYRKDEKLSRLVSAFSILAIFISCLGMIGMVEFSTRKRIKEIGIRKVIGASSGDIILLLSRNHFLLILVSMIIAFPLGDYTGSRWLMSYAYKTPVSWWIFALSGLSALVIILLSVSYQTIKAAISNPVKALRYE